MEVERRYYGGIPELVRDSGAWNPWMGTPGYTPRKYGQLTLTLTGGGGLGLQIGGGLGWD
jgi:hypothetical protein